ncbi:MAG TPA: DNA-binding protein [Candidatus Thermoplasmatota archaeon]|nr:DNA-binding protein [Candidatus Thermoplasmatota archaeon]
MDDLEALRQKRLRELQAQAQRSGAAAQDPAAQEQAAAEADLQQQAALDRVLQQILDSEARERLTRIRMSRPELAEAVTRQLVTLAQQGRLSRRLTDADLRTILAQVPSDGRDIKITRK